MKYKTPEMLPCPFCGGPASVRSLGGWQLFDPGADYPFGTSFSVGCAQPLCGEGLICSVQPRTNDRFTPQVAADLWNTRRPLTAKG